MCNKGAADDVRVPLEPCTRYGIAHKGKATILRIEHYTYFTSKPIRFVKGDTIGIRLNMATLKKKKSFLVTKTKICFF